MDMIPILFAQVAIVVVAAVAALAGVALGTRVLWRLTERAKPREAVGGSPGDFRRLETAVEAIAIEVERISEAQRYTVALLSDRNPPREEAHREGRGAAAALPPITTPH